MTVTAITGNRIYTASDVCTRARITYRQLDYWARTGRLGSSSSSPGSGFERLFTLADIDRAAVIRELLHAGMSLTTACLAAQLLLDADTTDGAQVHLTGKTVLTVDVHAVRADVRRRM